MRRPAYARRRPLEARRAGEADDYSPVYTLKGYRAAHGSRVRSAMIGGPAAADKGDR